MPLFICDVCETIDNTAVAHYWSRNFIRFKNPDLKGKALCSECTPKEFNDGSLNRKGGEWHNIFPKEKFDVNKHNPDNYINSDKYKKCY